MPTYESLSNPPPPPGPADWNAGGYLIKEKMIPDSVIDDFCRCWLAHNQNRLTGWPDCTPYMRHTEVMELLMAKNITDTIIELIGEPGGVHLNLSGWLASRRNWHQDIYLSPEFVGDSYAAVWIALDDVHPDSGPFQFVPGSHRWPVVSNTKILAALPPEERGIGWPKYSENWLTPIFENEIAVRGAEVVTYLPKKGDVLFWHGRLVHRGSEPNVPGMLRKSMIAHFTGINHRQDMPTAVRYTANGCDGYYFPINGGSLVPTPK